MKRYILTLALFLTLCGLVVTSPVADIESSHRTVTGNTGRDSYKVSGIGDNSEDFVDQISDLHFPTDKGTHNVFSDLQNYGSLYDAVTEVDMGSPATNYEDPVDQISDLHGPSDIGTHTSFAEMQDHDSLYDTLTEYTTGGVINASAKTNAFIAYRDSTTSLSQPKEQTWNGESASWSGESLMATAGSTVRFTRVAYSTNATLSEYRIVVTLSDDGYLDAYVWNGTAWSVTNNIASVGTSSNAYRAFDIAFENSTGEALLVYATGGTTNELGYAAWKMETGWSSTSTYELSYTTGRVNWVALATGSGARSGTADDDEIALIYIDSNTDVHGYIWTGSAWDGMGASAVWDADAAIATEECIAVAYETTTGQPMWIWADTTSTDFYYRTYDGTTLSAATLLDIALAGGIGNWLTLKSNPSNDDLLLVSLDAGSDLNTRYWSGSAWTSQTETDAACDGNAARCADFAWATDGSYGILVWGTAFGSISWRRFTPTNTWTSTTTVPNTGTHLWIQLRTNPRAISGDTLILGATLNSNFDIFPLIWSGSSLTIGGALSTDTTASTYECFDIEFQNFGPVPPINNRLDLEVGWSNAPYSEVNEYLCVYGGTQDAEALQVDVWYNAAWTPVIADVNAGWNNVSVSTHLVSAAFEIRFVDATQTGDGFQSAWDAEGVLLHCWSDVVIDHELDLETSWTTADYDESNEYLCIYPVTGGGWPAEDIMVDVWSGAWVNVIADLMPDQWNNVSAGSYLTGSAFEIRFLGGIETGDTVQDTWEIDAVLIHAWTPSYIPAIDQTPTLDNPTDTDNMYAQYAEYQVTVYVSDQNGFVDIDFLEIGLSDDSRATEFCRFRYDEDTNVFSEVFDGGTYVSLNTGSSSAVESGNDIDATFYFTIDWDFPDSTDVDAICYVLDTQVESATTWYEVDWDTETRLDYFVSPGVSDSSGTPDRGNLDESFSLTGTVIYYGSGNDVPSSTAVDVWVLASEYGTSVGPWSDLTLASGAFDVTCYADNLVGQDTYTIKVVEEGTGAGGADLFYTTSATDAYIADQLVVTITNPVDQRINIGANATGIIASAIYDYDDSNFDGTLTLNDTTFDYATVGLRGYEVSTASGGAHGVSFIGINDETYCIWDSLTITITNPPDQRININANASGILVTAIYDYDSLPFDGTLGLNNTQFSYATAQIQWYSVGSVIGGAHGITAISVNDVTFCIWDSLTIVITNPSDQRININANATGIIVSATYDYDGTAFDGTLNLNNTEFTYSFAQRQGYTVQSVSGGIYGITAILLNDVTYCVWDSLTVTITEPSDQRINVNTNASGIVVTAVYDYDGTLFDGTLILNNTQFTYTLAQIQWYTVESVSGGAYGITAISANDMTWCIWDSLRIMMTDPIDQRININANASGITVSAVYEYDDSVFDGILILNNTQFTYASAQIQWYLVQSASGGVHGINAISSNDLIYCIWDSLTILITDPSDQRINISANASGIIATAVHDYDSTPFDGTFTLNNTQFIYTSAQIQWYTVQGVSGGTYGITAISTNDVTYCIWDSLTIAITDPTDQRININSNASGIVVTAMYDYDGAAFDGTFTLNNTQFAYAVAQKQGYTVQSVSGGTHGITAISINDVTYCVWDSLTIVITDPMDQRINVDANATGIVVTAVYDYDGAMFDGTLSLNNSQFTYSIAQKQAYTVQSVSGGTHGITAISTSDVTYCIWDSLTISITGPSDQHVNINTNASGIVVTAVYDYDGAEFDGVLALNNTQFTYSTAQIQWYTVQGVSGGTYGITVVSANDETYCIWDSLTVSLIDPSDQRININANATGIIVSAIYDYDGSAFDGILTLNNSQFSYGTAQIQWYTVGSVSGGVHGITAISSNDVTYCIWDSLRIVITDPLDQHIDINRNASGIVVAAVYNYDGSAFDGALTLNNTQFMYSTEQIQWYTVLSASGGTYGITVISTNDATYCIWDSLTITISDPSDQRININANASGIVVSAVYDYEGSVFDGILTLNNTQFIYGTAQIQWYTVLSASGGTHGISAISVNDATYCIWDQLVITIGVDDSTPLNGVQANFSLTVIFDYDNTVCTSYQIVIQRNGTWWQSFTNTNKSLFVDLNFDTAFTYAVRLITSESLYSILSFSTNSVQVMWAAEPNIAPVNDAAPVLTNPDDASYMYAKYKFYIITSNVSDADGYDDIVYVELTVYDDSRTIVVWTVRYTLAGGTFSVQLGSAYIVLSASSSASMSGNDLDITWYIEIDWDHSDLSNVDVKQYVYDGASGVEDYYESDWDIETRLEVVGLTIQDGTGTSNRGPLDGSFLVTGTVIYLGSVNEYPLSDETDVWVLMSEYGIAIGPWSDPVLVSGQFSITAYADDQVGLDTITIKVVEEGAGSSSMNLLGASTESTYIADRILVQDYTALDDRVNIGSLATIDVTLLYEYNASFVTDGTVTVNGLSASYQGVGVWRFTDSESMVVMNTYDTVVYTGGTHGLTQANQNGMSQGVIWDQIVVQSTVANDTRVSIGDVAEIRVTLWLAYDSTYLGTGDSVTLDGTLMTWDAGNSWFELVVSRSSVGRWIFFVNSSASSGYGITELDTNSQSTAIIWDQIVVQTTVIIDSHVGVGSSTEAHVTLWLAYDHEYLGDGDSVTMDDSSMSWNSVNSWWQYEASQFTVGKWAYFVNSSLESTYGITALTTNGLAVEVIWDQIVVQSTVADDTHANVGDNVEIRVTLWLAYDHTYLGSGDTVTLDDTLMTWDSTNSWFELMVTQSSVDSWSYFVNSTSQTAFGIAAMDLNSQTVSVIWDRIVVQTTTVDDSRLSTGDDAEVRVTLMLEYDGSYLGPADSVTLDGRVMTWDVANSWFTSLCTQLSVGEWTYYVNSTQHVGHGITALALSGHSVSIIWDRIQVQSYSASDARVNIGDSVSIDVTLRFEYDNTLVDSGTVTVNGISAVSQGLGVWRFTDSQSAVSMNTYNLVACSGNAYGITAVNQNAQSIAIIWDRLVIMIGVDDASMFNDHQANFTITVTFDYDDSVCSAYQIVIDRNAAWWHSFSDANVSLFVDIGSDISHNYTARIVSAEPTYGITLFVTNTLLVTWSLEPNELPVNDGTPTLTNADDIDYLYARCRFYVVITSVSDPDGYSDINYVEISLYSDNRVTLYWTVRYTRATDTFSVEVGGTVVVIGSMSEAVGAGNTLTITWCFKIGWEHEDIVDSDVEQFVFDGVDSDSDFYETNWNVETRLDYFITPSLSDDRGDVNTADLVASGSITYYGSSLSPLANETDVWIIHDVSGSWNGDLAAGSFSISGIGSSASVRLNTYTIKIVAEGAGSASADLYYSTSPTDTFITDRIEVYLAGAVDLRININSNCEVWWRARYEYSGTEIQSGLVMQLNGSRLLVWNSGGSYWRWQETSPTPKSAGFYIFSAAESFYGLTEWTDSTIELQVIWDALIVTVTDPTDMRTNVGTNATGIHVSAVYAYDGATFDGILTLNNTVFSYATPQIQSYTVIWATSDSFGITAILSNDVAYCIWDRVLVTSITADELYHDPGDNVRVTVGLQYEYDASSVTSGTFAIGGHSLAHIGSGLWDTYVTEATYQAVSFDLLTLCNASLYGITGFNMASNEVTVYWDRIEFYSVSVDDGRLGIGDSALVQWSARLENADTIIPNGVVVMMTGDITCIPSGGVYVASVMQSTVGSRTFSIISASLGEIGSYVQSAADPTVIWDRVQVTSITATSFSQDVGVATEIRVTLVYEFDDSPFTSGSVSLSGATNAMTYNSAGAYWSVSVTKNTAGNYTFAVESISDSMYGISALDSASLSIEIAWVALPGFAPDTMTLLLIGGGVGVGLIGVALIASRRRRGTASVGITDIEPSDFGIYDATATAPSEPDIAETSIESAEAEADTYPPAKLPAAEVHEPLEVPPAAELAAIEETEPTSISVEEMPVAEEVLPTEPVREEPLPVEAVEMETIEAVTAPETTTLPESGYEIEAEKPLTKEELLDRLPPEVRDAIPKEDLEKMSRKEAQSLVDSYTPPEEPLSEPIASSADTGGPDIALRTKELSKLDKKSLVALLPPEIKETISPDELKRLSKKELVSLLASYMEP